MAAPGTPHIPLRHGAFLPPFHPMNENPGACIERDLELMRVARSAGSFRRGLDPGEHHSAGWELISSPEAVFIAVAAERTKWIRFGTGVIFVAVSQSADDRQPDHPAEDHHTRGRIMFGAGPGLLASDALMLGIDPNTQRDRMAEALDVILRASSKAKVITERTEVVYTSSSTPGAHILPCTNRTPRSRWSAR